jgi:hypothetical protein
VKLTDRPKFTSHPGVSCCRPPARTARVSCSSSRVKRRRTGKPVGPCGRRDARSGNAAGSAGNIVGGLGNTLGRVGNTAGASGKATGRLGNTPGLSRNTAERFGNTTGPSRNIPGRPGNTIGRCGKGDGGIEIPASWLKNASKGQKLIKNAKIQAFTVRYHGRWQKSSS